MIVVVVVAAGLCHHHAAVAKGGEANHGSAPKASSFHAVSGTDRPAERLRVAILPPDCAVALPVPQMTTENIAAISTAAQAANHRWKVQACCFHLRMRARQAEEGGRRQLLRRHGELPPSLLPRLPWQRALPRHLPEHLGAVAAVARGDHRRVFYLLYVVFPSPDAGWTPARFCAVRRLGSRFLDLSRPNLSTDGAEMGGLTLGS